MLNTVLNHMSSLIAGQWVADSSSSPIINLNPSDTSDVIGEFCTASTTQVSQSLEAAQQARQVWHRSSIPERCQVLQSIAREIMQRSKEIGYLIAREEGKTLREGISESYGAGAVFEYYAAETMRQVGENADSFKPNIEIDVRREPVGTVAILTPWNFPVGCAAWKIAPALAFGNAVIWKPSSIVPASACLVADIINRSALPKGLFSLVLGSGRQLGQQLAESSLVDAITFTGSVGGGRAVARAAIGNLSKVQLEMGSKNPLLIMDDADMAIAIHCAVYGAYSSAGQKCTATSRIIVHHKIHDEFVDKLCAEITKLRVGHALQPESDIGAIGNEDQLKSNLGYVALAQQEGCEKVFGGEQLERETLGFFMSPALLVNSHNDMIINREEIFGPVACVIKVDSYEEGLAIANDSEFGLASSIITQSLAKSKHFRRNTTAGMIKVNLPTVGADYHMPFGGLLNSSFGPREQGQHANQFYTNTRTSYVYSGDVSTNSAGSPLRNFS